MYRQQKTGPVFETIFVNGLWSLDKTNRTTDFKSMQGKTFLRKPSTKVFFHIFRKTNKIIFGYKIRLIYRTGLLPTLLD